MDDDRVEKVLAVIRKNVPRGETVNKEFYVNFMKRLRAAMRGRDLRCGKTTAGCCTMTMHLLTHHSLSVNF